jgi:hypothetical protein
VLAAQTAVLDAAGAIGRSATERVTVDADLLAAQTGSGSIYLEVQGDVALTDFPGMAGFGGGLPADADGMPVAAARAISQIDSALDLDILVAGGGLTGNAITVGGRADVAADGAIQVTTLRSGGPMQIDAAGLTFAQLTASSVDARIRGAIQMGNVNVGGGRAQFRANGNIVDNNSLIRAGVVGLDAGGSIGSAGRPIRLDAGVIESIVARQTLHAIQQRTGPTPIGLISAGGGFHFTTMGGLTDNNGPALNFSANADSYLYAWDTVGTDADPLEVDVNNGRLYVGVPSGREVSGFEGLWMHLSDPNGAQSVIVRDGDLPGLVLLNRRPVAGGERILAELARTYAFVVETPELTSRMGVFGSPYMVHPFMQVTESAALGLVDYLVSGVAQIDPGEVVVEDMGIFIVDSGGYGLLGLWEMLDRRYRAERGQTEAPVEAATEESVEEDVDTASSGEEV